MVEANGAQRLKAALTAENYYDSPDADTFYSIVWGGEDIHIGLYEEGDSISEASHRTLDRMAGQLPDLGTRSEILDIGAGYGGAARYLARKYGCRVTCLNLSEVQNARNRELTKAAGLDAKISIVHGAFEDLPFEGQRFDVVWSQDAILHSGDRPRVIQEVARVLRPDGHFLFTDPMQSDNCPKGVLDPVLARIHLTNLGSIFLYRETLRTHGLEEVTVTDLTHQLGNHYTFVKRELSRRRDELSARISDEYIERMLEGLDHWIDAEKAGHLAWGILHFRKS